MARSEPALLFDVQGPQGKRRMLLLTVAILLLIGVGIAFALVKLGQNGHLAATPWLTILLPPVSTYLLEGLWMSLLSGLLAGLLAFPLGIVLAILRMSRNRVVRGLARWYIEITRSIPVLLVMYFVQLFLPSIGWRVPVFWQLILPLALYHISMLAEIFRAGVESIPPGQREAAEALGLRPLRIYQQVILPQAIRVVLPSLINQFIRLFKDTSLGYIVTYPELLTRGKVMGDYTGYLFETFVIVGVVYLVVDLVLAAAARALDRRLRAERGGAPRTARTRAGGPSAAGLTITEARS